MKPIPVSWHLGPLVFHTYGLGLAVTFYFAYYYLSRRLRHHGYPYEWVRTTAVYVVIAALVGARIMHVIANAGYYLSQPVQVFEVWNGGLSSFGGLALGVPTGFLLAKQKAREVPSIVLADLVAPVLLASWAMGRLLGPQLMYAGGGHATHQWFGMYYAGQVGRRLPVPIFQALLTFAVLLIAWQVERYAARREGLSGLVISVAVGFWGLDRFIEEHLWLAYPGHPGAVAVQVAGLVMCFAGFGAAFALLARCLASSSRRKAEVAVGAPGHGVGMSGAGSGPPQSADA